MTKEKRSERGGRPFSSFCLVFKMNIKKSFSGCEITVENWSVIRSLTENQLTDNKLERIVVIWAPQGIPNK
jgi:hypothetical protein